MRHHFTIDGKRATFDWRYVPPDLVGRFDLTQLGDPREWRAKVFDNESHQAEGRGLTPDIAIAAAIENFMLAFYPKRIEHDEYGTSSGTR